MANKANKPLSEMILSVSDSVSSAMLKIDIQTISNSADGVTFYMTHKGLYNYVGSVKSKADEDMKKEQYYIIAIINLIKKTEFLQLLVQLAEKSITEDEYEKELEENPSKYIIDFDYLRDVEDLPIISTIINNIGKGLRVDEVSELFSIESNSLNIGLKSLSLY